MCILQIYFPLIIGTISEQDKDCLISTAPRLQKQKVQFETVETAGAGFVWVVLYAEWLKNMIVSC